MFYIWHYLWWTFSESHIWCESRSIMTSMPDFDKVWMLTLSIKFEKYKIFWQSFKQSSNYYMQTEGQTDATKPFLHNFVAKEPTIYYFIKIFYLQFDFVGAERYRVKGTKDSKPSSFINTSFVLKLKKDPEPWAPKLILLRLLENIKVRYWGGGEEKKYESVL